MGDTSLSKDLPYHLLPDSTQKKKKRAVDLTTAFEVLQITYNLPGKVNKDLLLDLVCKILLQLLYLRMNMSAKASF